MGWIDTYPHKVYASVLLLDNKIFNWKIGENYWSYPYQMTMRFPLPDNFNESTVEHTFWEVNSSEEHSKVFEEYARHWFKNWEIHEDYIGSNPY